MPAQLTTVADGVHVGPLFPRHLFNTVVLEGPEGDVVAGFEVLAQPGHSPGLLAFWREADRTLVVGDGPINISTDPTDPRWFPLPRKLHHDPRAAVASRWRMTRLEPELIISTHGYPVRGVARWMEGVRSHAH